MWFVTRHFAALSALRDLEAKLPPQSDDNEKEWGTVIYRVPFSDGSWGYCYQVPYQSNTVRHWSPAGEHMYGEYGSEPVGYCHTHPNLTGFSSDDTAFVDVGPNKSGSVAYMVNREGAYSYDGRNPEIPKPSRFRLLWGKWWKKD
jgi:hypothetical protein